MEPELFLTLQPAWRSYIVFYVAILIFGIGPTINPEVGINKLLGWVVSLFLIFLVIYRQKSTFYRITQEEAQRETSFASQVFKKSLPLREIAGLEVRRGIIHRLLGIGHLQFRSKTPGQPDLWWFGIKDPFMVKKRIEQVLR
ncbi:MAG: hypothetical protein WA974_15870 [Thermodesulfobacteriota bacterium]